VGCNVGNLTSPHVSGSSGSVSVTRTRRAVRGGWETSTPKSAKSRRMVPVYGWLADDLRAYLANDHPYGEPASPDDDPAAPLFLGRSSMTEPLPQGFSRDEIEPVRPLIARRWPSRARGRPPSVTQHRKDRWLDLRQGRSLQ
jgi:integrase